MHLVGERDLFPDPGSYTQQFQRRFIQDNLVFPLRHMSFFQINVTPSGVIFVHIADLRRIFGKNPFRHRPGHNPFPGLFHLPVIFDGLCLLIGHILERSVSISADLPEGVGLITFI